MRYIRTTFRFAQLSQHSGWPGNCAVLELVLAFLGLPAGPVILDLCSIIEISASFIHSAPGPRNYFKLPLISSFGTAKFNSVWLKAQVFLSLSGSYYVLFPL